MVCSLCKLWEESTSHLFLGCLYNRVLWREGPSALNTDDFTQVPFVNWVKFIFNPSNLLHHVREKWLHMMLYIVVLTNTLWFTKNKVVHENLVPNVKDMKKFVSRYMKSTVRHGLARDAPLDDLLLSQIT